MNQFNSRQSIADFILRLGVSICIASHGWHRLLSGGYEPFGAWLNEQGFPFGVGIAWSITLLEAFGSPFLLLGKKLPYLCAAFISILFMGILMVHGQHGWFVVGSGSNGIEYSFLLIISLLAIAVPRLNEISFLNKNQLK